MQYAIIYGCDEWLDAAIHTEFVWLLSREREMSVFVEEIAYEQFDSVLPFYDREKNLLTISQDQGCSYDREVEEPESDSEKYREQYWASDTDPTEDSTADRDSSDSDFSYYNEEKPETVDDEEYYDYHDEEFYDSTTTDGDEASTTESEWTDFDEDAWYTADA